MSRKERERIKIMAGIEQDELTVAAAAALLGLSYRQTRRVWRRYQAQGDAGLVHRSRGRPSSRSKPAELRGRVLARYRQRYPDFGPTLAAEYLGREDDLKIDHETLRRWLLAEGLRAVRRRRQQHRQWRERKACFGEMVQMDGSHHDWFEGRRVPCVLMVMVDDATNRVRARFFEEETTRASYDTFESWVRRYGVPRALYVDRDSIYRCEGVGSVAEQLAGREPQTQFGRAMEQLGVKLILARSPQAKGRVERMNGVLQDRLVKALRLAGISDLERANAYLDKVFLPALNRRLERVAAQAIDLHQAVLGNLEEILSWEEQRVVQPDWTVAWNGQWYQLDRQHEPLSLARRQVQVRRLRDGREQIVYRGQKLQWRRLPARPERARPERRPVGPVRKFKPAVDHPWRRYAAAASRKHCQRKGEPSSEIPGAPIRAGGAGPLRRGDRRRRELGLESRRRRPPARSNRRRGHAQNHSTKGTFSPEF